MEQSNIIQAVTAQFADKFNKLAKVKIKDPIDEQSKEDQPLILVTFLGLEEVFQNNPYEKIQCKEEDKQGNVFEYYLPPASLFNLSYMITPYFKTYTDTLKILGSIVKLVKDAHQIPIEEYDWLDNNKMPAIIIPTPKMPIEKQMQIFSIMRLEYRPSLFYQVMVGINSDNKEGFRRVEARKFDTLNLRENKAKN